MDSRDQNAIEALFARLDDLERRSAPRDPQADTFIRQRIASQPGAPYYMAQTIVVLEQALQAAQARIDELERRTVGRPAAEGGFMPGIFGGDQPSADEAPRRPGSVPSIGRSGALPPPGAAQPGRGGGFLAGAAQTAMGVAGGYLLGNAIAGMFGGDAAKAAEAPKSEAPKSEQQEPDAEPADESGGFFDSIFGGGDDET